MRSCGEHYSGQVDEPSIPVCHLCPTSPTYWRRDTTYQEAVGADVLNVDVDEPPGTGSAEVPAAAGTGDAERGEAAADEVGGAVGAFEVAVNEQRVGVERSLALGLQRLVGADDVDYARLVFEVDEHDAAGGGWALPLGDEAADADVLPGLESSWSARCGAAASALVGGDHGSGDVALCADSRCRARFSGRSW